MSPHDQIVRTKVARAKQLLTETDYALDTIAAKSGLSHAAYLNVLFKREVGQTPGEFRKSVVRQNPTHAENPNMERNANQFVT